MARVKLRKWDSAEHLETDEDVANYLDACLDVAGDDPAFIDTPAVARSELKKAMAAFQAAAR